MNDASLTWEGLGGRFVTVGYLTSHRMDGSLSCNIDLQAAVPSYMYLTMCCNRVLDLKFGQDHIQPSIHATGVGSRQCSRGLGT